MSVHGSDKFSSWRAADLRYFVFSCFWSVFIGISVTIAFVIWSVGVIIIFGVILAIADFLLSGGLVLAWLSAITMLVWWTVFCILCGTFYALLLEDYPKRTPRDITVYIWWVGLGFVVAVVLGWRFTQDQTPGGIVDLIWVVALIVFGSYFVSSRSFPLVNTVKGGDTNTVTAVVSGYMITAATLEIVSYTFNAPIRSEVLDSAWSDIGMTAVYLPVILLAELIDSIVDVLGYELTVGTIITGQGLTPLVDFATFNLTSGTGMYGALAVSLVGIPTLVLIAELAYFGGVVTVISRLRSLIPSQSKSSAYWNQRTSRTSQLRTVLGQMVEDGINSTLNLLTDTMIFGLYVAFVAVFALLSAISLYIVIGGVNLLVDSRLFGTLSPVIGEVLTTGTEISVLGISLLIVATGQVARLDSVDDVLIVDGTLWDYPIMLPLVGMVPFWVWRSNSALVWERVIPATISVAVVWLLLYRVSIYLILTEKTTQKFELDKRQETIHNVFVDGIFLGKAVLGVGSAWLGLGLLFTLLEAFDPTLFQPTKELLRMILLELSLNISIEQTYVGVPLIAGGVSFTVYSIRSAVVTAVGYRQTVLSALSTIQDVSIAIAGRVRRWIEYIVLLRP